MFRKIEKEGESAYLYTILSYVIEAAEVSSQAAFFETIRKLESLTEEKVMTMAEQFRQEGKIQGKAEGKAEGRVEGKAEVALNMIQEGLTLETISKLTSLLPSELEALKKKLH